MTTLLVNVRDSSKVEDVVKFLSDIDFLDVTIKGEKEEAKVRRRPAAEAMKTAIIGNIMEPIVPDSNWEVLREAGS